MICHKFKMAAMARFTVALGISAFLAGLQAEFIVTHAPNHVQFLDNDSKLKLSEIQKVVSSAFGLQVKEDMSWEGLGAGDIFQRPKANFLFTVESDNLPALEINNIATYQTEQDSPAIETEGVVNDIVSIAEEKPLVVDFSDQRTVYDFRSQEPELFRNVPATYKQLQEAMQSGRNSFSTADMASLNNSRNVDLNFLGELHIIKEMLKALKDNPQLLTRRSPDFFHFKIQGVQHLAEEYGGNSVQVQDARTLLQNFLEQMTAELRFLYDDNVIVEVVTVPVNDQPSSSTFRARHLLQVPDAPTTASPGNLNLAPAYDDMYPVAFNIILWTMVTLTVALIGISCGIWHMDPGRDSIIYRMTSQRIKKD